MRIISAYITRSFLHVFLITLCVLIFVMAIANIFKVIDLFTRGMSGMFILKAFTYGMPFYLIFAIPMSVIAAAFLVFGRMSSDHEITAMRACGISLWQIMQPLVLLSGALSVLCVYINCSLAPNSHYARRELLQTLVINTPLSILDTGRFISDIPGVRLYVSKREGNKVWDIIASEFDKQGVTRTIRAEHGTVETAPETPGAFTINLYNVRIAQYDEPALKEAGKARVVLAEHYPMFINLAEMVGSGKVHKKRADLTMSELIAAIRAKEPAFEGVSEAASEVHRASLLVEVNTRLALSLSCYAFVVLGAALGMKIHRRESSIGMAVALGLVFAFYFFIIVADSLVTRPIWQPHLIVWIPFLLSELIGFILIRRAH